MVLVPFLLVGEDKTFCGSDASLAQYPGSTTQSAKNVQLGRRSAQNANGRRLLGRTIPVNEACSRNAKMLSCKLAVRRLVLRGKKLCLDGCLGV